MKLLFVAREAWALSWIAEEPAYMQRTSHALVHDGRYWLVDAVDGDGLSERLSALGTPAGVLQLFARHPRDGEALATRLDVPFHAVPSEEVPDSPFEVVSLGGGRLWNEVALWWAEHRALVVPESIGTVAYFRAGATASACGVPIQTPRASARSRSLRSRGPACRPWSSAVGRACGRRRARGAGALSARHATMARGASERQATWTGRAGRAPEQ